MQRSRRTRTEYRKQSMGALLCHLLEYIYRYVHLCRYWLKSSVSLVTIMGLTWIIVRLIESFVMWHNNYITNIDKGLLVFEVPALFPLAYIFTIFVAFQGVAIFVIFVPLSKQVRDAYSKWWRVKVAESDILSSYFSNLSFRNNSNLVSSHNGFTIL